MSVAVALQKAVFDALRADPAVSGLIAGRVYDRVPADSQGNVTATFPYVSFGPYDFVSDDAECIDAGEHTLQVDVWSRAVGRVEAKQVTDAVRLALHSHEADLGVYALVEMRVDFTQVIGDPDGLTSHGIVRIVAMIEEPA
ncbi:hypothetical protein MesoLjLc_45670 [Mesorhizobium sp. L-8-10]|uniref:DUF3168 domain-containing protein n=1 Tax=Mesorhizobium sp. L-8-10 TaxID=2744523 RepID=UPI0019267E2F|nr:DUF3168 domain-containing protein [Mesorhizobium sp. L-8-10]BCH32637.1 hypothetical protein MesoLjLc_45670 [Mesorhizobium sp. L-8-10]